MKRIAIVIFMLVMIVGSVVAAQDREIYALLQDRQEMFNKYADQIKKRSGIFGQQNKRDIKQSGEILRRIIDKDNQIIAELERMLDQRKAESLDAGVDRENSDQQNKRIIGIIDQMKLQNDALKKENDRLRTSGTWSNMIAIIASILAVMFLVFYLKSKMLRQI